MNKKARLGIYALHPITYQTPIYRTLFKIIESKSYSCEFDVLFGDDLSLREVYYEHLDKKVKFDNDLFLDEFPHKFMKNYSRDARKGFFSRINPSIFYRIIKDRYDVILIHGYETFTAWISLLAAKLLLRKVIFRGEAVLEGNPYKPGVTQKLKRVILPLFFYLFDAVMYSCEGNKRYFKFFGVPEEKLFLLPCAVNNDYYINQRIVLDHKVQEHRTALGIDKDEFVVLFSARFTGRKNPYDLINAVAQSNNKKITILFVGDGPERAGMEKAVKSSRVKAIFTGFVGPTELAKYYSVSNLDVVISSKDPSPKSLNEALIFSLPIIVTDVVGTASDLVFEDKNGFIVPVGDVNLISEKINYLASNPQVCDRMGKVSFNIVQSWTIESGAEGILEAMNFTLNKNRAESSGKL